MKKFNITVNGESYEVMVEEIGEETVVKPRPAKTNVAASKPLSTKPKTKTAPKKPAAAPEKRPQPKVSAGATTISAPMPGVILDVRVSEGQNVNEGDVLLILEAMKMENEVMAPSTGVVGQVAVAKGQNVNSGDILVVIE